MRRVVWMVIGLVLGVAGTATAGYMPEGRFSAYGYALEWKSGCSKPDWPNLSNADRYAIESAKSDYETYQSCLIRKAGEDSAYASQAVVDQAKKELKKVQSDGQDAGWTFN